MIPYHPSVGSKRSIESFTNAVRFCIEGRGLPASEIGKKGYKKPLGMFPIKGSWEAINLKVEFVESPYSTVIRLFSTVFVQATTEALK